MSKKRVYARPGHGDNRGRGFLSDLAKDVYRVGAKILTGENVPKGNPFAVPELNENFGIKDPRLVKFSQFAAPGTNLHYQLKRKPVNTVDKISQLHDINYQLAKNKEQVRAADNTMINQLSRSISNDFSITHPLRTMENIVLHPLRTTANIINKGSALGAIAAKTVAEDLGIVPQYGQPDKPNSKKFEQQLLKKKSDLIRSFTKKK